jgi:hypothetical protein
LAFIKARHDADSTYRILVRLLKRWRNFKDLELGSFAIELILAYLHDTRGVPPSLEEGVSRFFLFVAQTKLKQRLSFKENGKVETFPDDPVVILDPVNSSNNVTRRLTDAERSEIVKEATTAWETISTASYNNFKGETLEFWRSVFGRNFVIE